MKNIKKAIVIILVLLLCGCASKAVNDRKTASEYDGGYHYSNNPASDSDSYYPSEEQSIAKPSVGDDIADPLSVLPSKIIVTANIEMESSDLTKTVDQINSAILKVNGYVQASRIYSDDYSYYHDRSAYIVVRVPADKYEEFLAATEEYGNVLSVSTSADDITTEYYDLAARLESLKTQRERVMEFYKQAKTIEELILIENRLSEIDSEIASKEITMKNYDLLTNYSTVTFNISEVSKFTETEDTFFTRLKNTVSDSFLDFLAFLENALFFVINSFWYILLALAVILLVGKLNSKFNFLKKPVFRKKNNKKESDELVS